MEATPARAPLRCRTVTPTPTYDQLRGELINADVPASEADLQLDHPGEHRRGDNPPVGVVFGLPSGQGADFAERRSWPAIVDIDRPGKHRLRDDGAGVSVVFEQFPAPEADPAEDWSWFETGGPDTAGLPAATRPDHSPAVTHHREHAPATRADPAPRAASEPYVLLPPPAHARDRQSHETIRASRHAKTST